MDVVLDVPLPVFFRENNFIRGHNIPSVEEAPCLPYLIMFNASRNWFLRGMRKCIRKCPESWRIVLSMNPEEWIVFLEIWENCIDFVHTILRLDKKQSIPETGRAPVALGPWVSRRAHRPWACTSPNPEECLWPQDRARVGTRRATASNLPPLLRQID